MDTLSPQMLKVNNMVNEFLQNSARIEMQLMKLGKHDLARDVRRSSSLIARFCIKISGLDEALKAFWDDKRALGEEIN